MELFNFSPIGFISSCYKEKFGIPRQPNLVTSLESKLILNHEFSDESVRGLEGFSHIWVSFVFHATQAQGWKQMVRPPRLGGNEKIGVFATRSMFRPNPMGLSVVELKEIEITKTGVVLTLLGCDLLDRTPVLDIKPYLPYVDSIPNAKGGFARSQPEITLSVEFTKGAELECQNASIRIGQNVELLIRQILQLDPRPSYKKTEISDRIYSMRLCDFDLRWKYLDDNKISVLDLVT